MECIFIFVYLQISFTLIVLCHFSLNFLKERPAGLSHGMDKFKISTARNDISCNIISSWRNGAGHCCNECAQFSTFIAVPLHSGFVGYILFLDCVRIATLVIDKWPGRPQYSNELHGTMDEAYRKSLLIFFVHNIHQMSEKK